MKFCSSTRDNLKDLYLNYLPMVKDRALAEKLLKENLPNCKVKFLEGEADIEEAKKAF